MAVAPRWTDGLSHHVFMWIERLQVEEGFLDGLDIRFVRGLNVVIGARGVGKTSVLELVRYALRLPHVDERRSDNANRHAEAVLSGGRVVLTYADNSGSRTSVVRSAIDSAGPPKLPVWQAPLILGQNELEGIGLDQHSRLRLIDTYAGIDPGRESSENNRLMSAVGSLTLQLREIALQRENLKQQELIRPRIEDELSAARHAEAALLKRAGSEAVSLRERLGVRTARLAAEQNSLDKLSQIESKFSDYLAHSESLHFIVSAFATEFDLNDAAFTRYQPDVDELSASQEAISKKIRKMLDHLKHDIAAQHDRISALADEIRPLRRDFEEIEAGAAASAQATARLERQLSEIDDVIRSLDNLEKRRTKMVHERSALMKSIDEMREATWKERLDAASRLSREFEPRIRIRMEHYGDRSAYVGALSAALRGSGLQHNQLAEWLADRMSPQELVGAVEADDSARLALIGELTSSRVERLVNHLAHSDSLGQVLTSKIDDLAVFELLVGRDYRSSEELSTGQRCAVVLPLLLADRQRVLLLDQPEDHLDNAYLVETAIDTLIARSNTAQTIIATHNANIPVLGDANMVVTLESDGRRGYVKHTGPLSDQHIVGDISGLMEGGREAFARRADFYGRWVRKT